MATLWVLADPSFARTLSTTERADCMRSVAEYYYENRDWPRPHTRDSFAAASSGVDFSQRAVDAVRLSNAAQSYAGANLSPARLQVELDRVFEETLYPDRLNDLYRKLNSDPWLFVECVIREPLAQNSITDYLRTSIDPRWGNRPTPFHEWWETQKASAAETPIDYDFEYLWRDVARPALSAAGRWASAANQLELPPSVQSFWTGEELLVLSGENGCSRQLVVYDAGTRRWSLRAPLPDNVHCYSWQGVWTGDELFIWGGHDQYGEDAAHAYIYNATADEWRQASAQGTPPRRTFSKMAAGDGKVLIWGGREGGALARTGAIYDLSKNTWATVAGRLAPSPRTEHTLTWTGDEFIVWGGWTDDPGVHLRDGRAYDPSTGLWRALPEYNAPSARGNHAAVWTGDALLIWGGHPEFPENVGRYDPIRDRWDMLPSGPPGRDGAAVAWTGSELLVWGGSGVESHRDGSRFNPATKSWTSMSLDHGPGPWSNATGHWTGSEFIVFGGRQALGASWNADRNSWESLPSLGPNLRPTRSMAWTGAELLSWGDKWRRGLFDPILFRWMALPDLDAPESGDGFAWDGQRAIVVGTRTPGSAPRAYDPLLQKWMTLGDAAPCLEASRQHTQIRSNLLWIFSESDSSLCSYDLESGVALQYADSLWKSYDATAHFSPAGLFVWGGASQNSRRGAYFDLDREIWSRTTSPEPSERSQHAAYETAEGPGIWGGVWDRQGLSDFWTYNLSARAWRRMPQAGQIPAPRSRAGLTDIGHATVLWGGEQDGMYGVGVDGGGIYRFGDWTPVSRNYEPHGSAVVQSIWTGDHIFYLTDRGHGAALSIFTPPPSDAFPTLFKAGFE